ncbi:MAG: glycosyltransferase family 4 protein [Myxococcota bacterium]
MRILHVLPSYVPAVQFGGPVVSTHRLNIELSNIGHEVSVVTTTAGVPEFAGRRESVHRVVDGISVTYVPLRWVSRIYWAAGFKQVAASSLVGADLLHSHGMYLAPGILAFEEARRRRVPSVVSPRGMLMRQAIKSRNRPLKRVVLATIERRRLRGSTLHFTSEFERQQSDGYSAARSAIVPLGTERFEEQEMPKDFTVGYLGRLAPEKNLEALVDVCISLKVPLLLAGGTASRYASKLVKRAEAAEWIRFVGRIEPSQRAAFFGRVSVVALPSFFESFGNAAAEAMSAGRPVIVSKASGIAEYVEESGAGIVVSQDRVDLSKAIRQLEAEHTARTLLDRASRARVTATTEFDWRAVAGRFERLYSDLVGAKNIAESDTPSVVQ